MENEQLDQLSQELMTEDSKPKKQKAKEDRIPRNALYDIIHMEMNHPNPMGFQERFAVVEYAGSVRIPHIVGEGDELLATDEDVVIGAIVRWQKYCQMSDSRVEYEIKTMTLAQIRDVAKTWIDTAKTLDAYSIKTFKFASEPGYCWKRIAIDPVKESLDFGLWEELVSRINPESQEAFVFWVGSLFTGGTDKSQYLWMYGDGGNGKSTVLRVFQKAFGHVMASEDVPVEHGKVKVDKFWSACVEGKRLVAFPDCGAPTFPTLATFKAMSGDDMIRVEAKYGKTRYIKSDAKFIFTANVLPDISTCRSDQRRAVICHIGPINGEPEPSYEERLWQEFPAFLGYCIDNYAEHCPGNGIVPYRYTNHATTALGEDNESDIDVLCDQLFDFHSHKASAILASQVEMFASEVNRLFNQVGVRPAYRKECLEWMRRTKGVQKRKTSKGWIYTKISPKRFPNANNYENFQKD